MRVDLPEPGRLPSPKGRGRNAQQFRVRGLCLSVKSVAPLPWERGAMPQPV